MDPFGAAVSVVVLLGALGGAGAWWWFSDAQRARRLLAQHPVTPIGKLRPRELARISGRVVTRSATRSPLTDTPCAAFHLKIQAPAGKHSHTTIVEDQHTEPFDVIDDSGTCHVDPLGFQLFLQFDGHGHSGSFDDPTAAEQALLEHHGLSGTVLGFNRTLRYQEATLAEGEEVTILGRVEVVELDGAPVLTLVPDPEHGLVVTDRAV